MFHFALLLAVAQALDWFVFTRKTAVMQRLADLVRSGHRWYVEGSVSREKAPYFFAKLDGFYKVGATRLQQSRARKTGAATFRVLALAQDPQDRAQPLRWWLLKTDGEAPPEASREKWRDALADRITITGMELVRHTRAGQARPAWTWRYEKEREQDLRNAVVRAVRNRRDDELRQLVFSIFRTPGFAGARVQVRRFRQLIVGEWLRHRGAEPLPELPERIGYVRRLPDVGRPLSELGVKVRSRRRN